MTFPSPCETIAAPFIAPDSKEDEAIPSSFVYAVAIIDITLRILCFLKVKVPLRELGNIFPESIPAIFEKYTKDIVLDLLLWAYVFIYTCFLVYITSYFIKKKK